MLLTTGSNDLPIYVEAIDDYQERVYARALIRQFDIKMLVTKASGKSGGFWEKVEAARECGVELIVIRRPIQEEGLSLEDAKRELEERFGL